MDKKQNYLTQVKEKKEKVVPPEGEKKKPTEMKINNSPNGKWSVTQHWQYDVQNTDIFCLRFDFDDQLLAAGCSDGSVKVFNANLCNLTGEMNSSVSNDTTPTTCLRWRPTAINTTKSVLVSVNSDGSIMHWHASSGKLLYKMQEQNNYIMCLDYNQDGSKFATGGKDCTLKIYDDDMKCPEHIFPAGDWSQRGHTNRIFSIKFLPDQPSVLITGGWDANINIWDLRQKELAGSFYGPNLSGDTLDYSKGEILAGSYRATESLQVWDFKTRKLQHEIKWDANTEKEHVYVYGAQFSKKDGTTILAGCSKINEAKLFERGGKYAEITSFSQFNEGCYTVDYANTSHRFAFGGGDGILYIMNMVSGKK